MGYAILATYVLLQYICTRKVFMEREKHKNSHLCSYASILQKLILLSYDWVNYEYVRESHYTG